MAILAAVMANGGVFQGSRILSSATVDTLQSEPTERHMGFSVNYFSKGGVCVDLPLTVNVPRHRKMVVEGLQGCYGWMGYGGSLIQWHPETKLGFSFVPTFLYFIDVNNCRGKELLAEAIRCARIKTGSSR